MCCNSVLLNWRLFCFLLPFTKPDLRLLIHSLQLLFSCFIPFYFPCKSFKLYLNACLYILFWCLFSFSDLEVFIRRQQWTEPVGEILPSSHWLKDGQKQKMLPSLTIIQQQRHRFSFWKGVETERVGRPGDRKYKTQYQRDAVKSSFITDSGSVSQLTFQVSS